MDVLFCVLEYLDPEAMPPISCLSCVANCLATACPDVQSLIDQLIFDCAVWVLIGGGDIDDVLADCSEYVDACVGMSCPPAP
jgi:hypothetical protein